MTTISIHTVVQPDGKIVIEAPELTPGQPVTITIAPEANANGQAGGAVTDAPLSIGTSLGDPADALFEQMRGKHARDIIAMLPGRQVFKTAQDVADYIREERASWED